MIADSDRGAPPPRSAPATTTTASVSAPSDWTEARGLRARHRASLRCELLSSCGRHRDPLDPRHLKRPAAPPSTFMLEPDELRAEARRLYAAGWKLSEIRAVLDLSAIEQAS